MNYDIEYVSISPKLAIILVVSLLFTIFFLVTLYLLLYGINPFFYYMAAAALLSTDLGVALWAYMVRKSEEYMKQYIPRILSSIDGRMIRFNTSVKAAVGVFWTAGKWVSSGRSRRYSFRSRFSELGEAMDTVVEIPPETWTRFTIVVNTEGAGIMELPAIKIKEPELRDTILLIVPGPIRYREHDYFLTVFHDAGDHASTNLRLRGDILEGQLVYHKKVKARASRLQIRAIISNDEFLRKLETVKWITEEKEQRVKQVKYKLSMDRPLIIAGKKKYLNPLQIGMIMARRLGITSMKRPYRTIIMGYGKGEYSLELVLDLPLRIDKISKIAFRPEPVTSK